LLLGILKKISAEFDERQQLRSFLEENAKTGIKSEQNLTKRLFF